MLTCVLYMSVCYTRDFMVNVDLYSVLLQYTPNALNILDCAACSSLKIQDTKIIAICALSHKFVGLYLRN